MTRRELFLGASALALVPLSANAMQTLNYAPGLVEERLAAGETVFIDVSASWCSTCRSQGRAIQALRDNNSAYDAAITFVRLDWDTYGRSEFAQSIGVRQRSTLILLRGDQVLGTVVGDTRSASIQALMNLALA